MSAKKLASQPFSSMLSFSGYLCDASTFGTMPTRMNHSWLIDFGDPFRTSETYRLWIPKTIQISPSLMSYHWWLFKGSSDPSHFIFEIYAGKSRIRHRTTLNLNIFILNRFWVDLEIQFQSRSKSDPTHSDIYFNTKMALVWTTLKLGLRRAVRRVHKSD